MFRNGEGKGGIPSRHNRAGARHHRKRKLPLPQQDDGPEGCHQHQHQQQPQQEEPPAVPWSDDLHREFVTAVFRVGIDESSPAVIAEEMITRNNYNCSYNYNCENNCDENHGHNYHRGPKGEGGEPFGSAEAGVSAAGARGSGVGSNSGSIPDPHGQKHRLAEYYREAITGERLKSHLQKLRKQKDREIAVFVGDYQNHLEGEAASEKRRKAIVGLRERARERRRRLGEARQRAAEAAMARGGPPPPTGIDASEVSPEEEDRLLSLYLPLEAPGRPCGSAESSGLWGASPVSFPAGGKAVGMLTSAVRRAEEAGVGPSAQERPRMPSPDYGTLLGDDDGENLSVASATSHAAVAAGELADALAPPLYHLRNTLGRRNSIIDCASSEDEGEDHHDRYHPFAETFGPWSDWGRGDGHEDNDRDKHGTDGGGDPPETASIPTLTEAEKNSPLGVSMRLTWDLIRYMHGVLAEERANRCRPRDRFATDCPDPGGSSSSSSSSNNNNTYSGSAEESPPKNLQEMETTPPALPFDSRASGMVYQARNQQANDNYEDNDNKNHNNGINNVNYNNNINNNIINNNSININNDVNNGINNNTNNNVYNNVYNGINGISSNIQHIHHGFQQMSENSFLATAMAANGPPPPAFMATLAGSVATMLGGGTEGGSLLTAADASATRFPPPPRWTHSHQRGSDRDANAVVTPPNHDSPSVANPHRF